MEDGSQSEKQWQDVLGVLEVQGERLDFDYMREWAGALKLRDDLIKPAVRPDSSKQHYSTESLH